MSTRTNIDLREREILNYRTKTQRRRTEAEGEEGFIIVLKKLGGKFRKDLKEEGKTKEHLLEKNLILQLEKFYGRKYNFPSFKFTPREINRLFQKLYLYSFRELDETIVLTETERKLEIPIIDRYDINKNCFEIVQQVEEYCRRGFTHIYDLVLLINGIPLVCIELKKATISNNEAFEQLKRYEEDRFLVKPSSIFNNFQLFIAINFQRVSCFGKRDIQDLTSLERLTIRLCDNEWFAHLDHLDGYFKPSKIIQRLFKRDTRHAKKFISKTSKFSDLARPNYFPEIKTRQTVSNCVYEPIILPQNTPVISKELISKAFICVLFMGFFLLINFLSGGQGGTILIGLFVLGGAYRKRKSFKLIK